MTKEQYDNIMNLIRDKEQWKKMIDYFKVISVWHLSEKQYEYALEILQRRNSNVCSIRYGR